MRVIDGDTIVIDRGSGQEKLRFILIDTPETKHPNKGVEYFGKEASAFTTNSLDGKTVYIEKDVSETDRYNRLLRYVWIEKPTTDEPTNEGIRNKCFNAILLLGGYANVTTFPPDIKYVDFFRQLEKEGRESNTGLWGDSGAPVEEVQKEVQEAPKSTPKNTGEKAYLHANGKIIGNKNSMIYHIPTGRDYDKVTYRNAVFFNTEAEAQEAGYRRAKR
ncbi:MAG: nuclease [Tissierellia bacterium]|nr:nuclease [Tissierellia bacterium]